jgi:hypothetical protein
LPSSTVDIVEPARAVLERIVICEVEHDERARGAPVMHARDGAEVLLAAGVSQLRVDLVPLCLHDLHLAFGADGQLRIEVVDVVEAAKQKARFPDAGVADSDDFE